MCDVGGVKRDQESRGSHVRLVVSLQLVCAARWNGRTEFHAGCRFPDERVETYMANCERAVCLQSRDTVEEMHVRVREDDTI